MIECIGQVVDGDGEHPSEKGHLLSHVSLRCAFSSISFHCVVDSLLVVIVPGEEEKKHDYWEQKMTSESKKQASQCVPVSDTSDAHGRTKRKHQQESLYQTA